MVFTRFRNVAFAFQERPQSPQRRPRRGPRGAQDSPREVRRGPGPAQESPKSHPERPQRLMGAAQDDPGTALEGPGGARERPRSGPRDPEAPRKAPRMRKPSVFKPNRCFRRGRRAQNTSFTRLFLTAQASLSSLLDVLVEARARPATQTKTLFEITGRKVFRDSCGTDVHWPVSTKLSD